MIGTVLIVDDVATNRIVLKVKLGAAGYRTLTSPDGPTCLELARREKPDLILMDAVMPGLNGLEVLRALREDPVTARILVVMFSGRNDEATRLAALRAGADDFLSKPIDDQTLFARLRSLARWQEAMSGFGAAVSEMDAFGLAEAATPYETPGAVAIVTSRPETAMQWRKSLAPFSTHRFVPLLPDHVFDDRREGEAVPDVYLISSELGGAGSGLKLMSSLRSRQDTHHAFVCILNEDSDPTLPQMAFDLGANDLVDVSQSAQEIALRLHGLIRRKREGDRLRATMKDSLRLAMTDPLTGLPNRRYGLAQLGLIAERSIAENRDFALMVLDLDRFKSVNDRFGHAAGDKVLVEVARRLANNLRENDLIARIGGEEFLVCLPDTTLAESQDMALRLCQAIECEPVTIAPRLILPVTISIGLALSHELSTADGHKLVDEIFDRADRALLSAKGAGRNQVTISRSAA